MTIYRRKCLDCRGTGVDDDRIDRECHGCRGYGYIIEEDDEHEPIAEGDYHRYIPPGRIEEATDENNKR